MDLTRVRPRLAASVAAVLVLLGSTGCGSGSEGSIGDLPASTAPDLVPAPTPTNGGSWAPRAASVRERLAVLEIDDRPTPVGRYRRDDWPHWDDPDGNGCDARQDTLIRWSATTAQLDPSRRCKVVAGTWTSPYDGVVATTPADIQIDHLVPLAEAFRSGGWRWEAGRRRQFANDPDELVAASGRSNQSKGDSPPNEWRPTLETSWCAYADRWVTVKDRYDLTVTTEERDALGQMLDTCNTTSQGWP